MVHALLRQVSASERFKHSICPSAFIILSPGPKSAVPSNSLHFIFPSSFSKVFDKSTPFIILHWRTPILKLVWHKWMFWLLSPPPQYYVKSRMTVANMRLYYVLTSYLYQPVFLHGCPFAIAPHNLIFPASTVMFAHRTTPSPKIIAASILLPSTANPAAAPLALFPEVWVGAAEEVAELSELLLPDETGEEDEDEGVPEVLSDGAAATVLSAVPAAVLAAVVEVVVP
jgi:hypothetical protein